MMNVLAVRKFGLETWNLIQEVQNLVLCCDFLNTVTNTMIIQNQIIFFHLVSHCQFFEKDFVS